MKTVLLIMLLVVTALARNTFQITTEQLRLVEQISVLYLFFLVRNANQGNSLSQNMFIFCS